MDYCGRCLKEDCEQCKAFFEQIEENKRKACSDDCNCACVYERLNKEDLDPFSSSFKLGCCSSLLTRKTIEKIKQMELLLISERIQYKLEKDKMTSQIKAQNMQIQEIVRQLMFKGISIKL